MAQVGPGTVLAGRYKITDHIAGGGMGEVWSARDTVLDRPVAVKVLKTEYADDALFRQRFGSEARHAAASERDVVCRAGQPKVGEHRAFDPFFEQNVGRLHVAVHQSLLVSRRKPGRGLHADAEHFL